ncbi:transposase [Streptomyces sp. NPDC093982]|uniref:transposase n=1 Tax=Streptomyces sp. NPDC093982 TaxID=3155077 RepID=UPI00343707C5
MDTVRWSYCQLRHRSSYGSAASGRKVIGLDSALRRRLEPSLPRSPSCATYAPTSHLLVHYPPKVAISPLVGSLTGVSARHLRQDFPDHIRASCGMSASTSPPRAQAPRSPSSRSTSRTRNVPPEVNSADPRTHAGESSVKKRLLPNVNTRGSALDHAELAK